MGISGSFFKEAQIMLKLKNKAQSTAEYAIVIGLVIAAVLAMQVYVRRNLQAKIKATTDFGAGDGAIDARFKTVQFEPDYTTTTGDGLHTSSNRIMNITSNKGGGITRNIIGKEKSERTGVQVTDLTGTN